MRSSHKFGRKINGGVDTSINKTKVLPYACINKQISKIKRRKGETVLSRKTQARSLGVKLKVLHIGVKIKIQISEEKRKRRTNKRPGLIEETREIGTIEDESEVEAEPFEAVRSRRGDPISEGSL